MRSRAISPPASSSASPSIFVPPKSIPIRTRSVIILVPYCLSSLLLVIPIACHPYCLSFPLLVIPEGNLLLPLSLDLPLTTDHLPLNSSATAAHSPETAPASPAASPARDDRAPCPCRASP